MSSNSFEVTFKFDGGLADRGELDGSDHEAATGASRRLLALHAHCFLHGKVPSAALSDGRGYQVRHVATIKGSHADVWNVFINNAWTIQIVGGAIGGAIGTAYADEIKAGINAGARFLRDSVRAVLGSGPGNLPEFRVEPVLEAQGGNRQPIVDHEAEHDHVRVQLRELTIKVLHDVARPVGRSASRLTILIEGQPVAVIDEAVKRRMLADQITIAMRAMRHRQPGVVGTG